MKRPPPLRSLPRLFLPGCDMKDPIELPSTELDKLRKVLRLGTGDPIAILPNDGSLWRCRLEGRTAVPEAQEWPETEPELSLTLAQAQPKNDRLETVLRMGTELGVARFVLFPSERSVVRWEASKQDQKAARLSTIVREAAEQSYRSRLPELSFAGSLDEVLRMANQPIVLSEVESAGPSLFDRARERIKAGANALMLVVGPEGGWSPAELRAIGDRAVTLGPLVLRTDTAGPAAISVVLMGAYAACSRNSPRR